MQLEVNNPDKLELDDFIVWLMADIAKTAPDKTLRNLPLEELWYKYFSNIDLGWVKDSKDNFVIPTIEYIINTFFENLIAVKDGDDYVIKPNSEIKLNNTDIPIELLADIMNHGTLDTPSYPYFDFIFDMYSDDLQELYDIWLEEFGGTEE